ncbi:MAG: Succinyl-CoA synthetase, alpha subunit-related enzyme [Deltaproteobacteria bacterium]|nr:Succinyl-CoA synthetase, alpha subunit-related enzyme [Deltaproteobacteria bacterium]
MQRSALGSYSSRATKRTGRRSSARAWRSVRRSFTGHEPHPPGRTVSSVMAPINDARLREILTLSPTIAVLGIHHEPEKAAYYVPEYLHGEGYRIIGVNPAFLDRQLFGEPVRATLAEISEPIDIVDVFRRGEHISGHVEDILAMKPRPKVVWFQLGIKNEDAAKILEAAGITVVQNRCTLADHQRLGLGSPAR